MATPDRTAASTFNRVALDLTHEAFPELGAALRTRSDRILKHWRGLSLKAMPHLDTLTLEEFEDTIAEILSAAADAVRSADPRQLRGVMDHAPSHGVDRFVQEYSLLDLFEEVRILRGVVVIELAEEMKRPLVPGESATFHAIFDIIIQQGVLALVQKQNEQAQKLLDTARDMNERLLVATVRQDDLLEQAEQAQAALRERDQRLAGEAAALARLNALSSQLWRAPSLREGLDEMVAAVIELLSADMGTAQLLEPDRRVLVLAAQSGFERDFLDFFREVSAEDDSACGRALRSGERIVIEDVEADAAYGPLRPVARAAGYRAVQSTPLISHDGSPLGMLSAHFSSVRRLEVQELKRLDLYVRQAADFIERSKIEAEHSRLAAIVEHSDDAIISMDLDGVITTWNRGAQRLFGFTAAEVMGKPISLIIPEDRRDDEPAILERIRRGESIEHYETIRRHKDGKRLDISLTVSPIRDATGRVIGASKIARDISDRVAMEKRIKEQAGALAGESRRKDEFLAMLSHELRNPLAPIRAAVHLMSMQELGGESPLQRQAREIIERQVANLTKIVSDLLEVSRVVSGRIRLDRQAVDLNRILHHAIETATPLIDHHKHTLKLNLCSEAEGVWVSVDPTRVEEVFINLLNNAAKYTPDGGRIEVWCERARASDSAQVRIRDSGVGIDQELLPRIFDLFTQADRSLARSGGGLGIGLALAHRLVDLHGGTIEAHSPPEGETKGSEFIVRLPLMALPPAGAQPHPSAENPKNPGGLRVLLVDDNTDLVMMLSSTLRHGGYNVQVAYTGPNGLEAARQWRPDVVLLDIGLPGMDGYEVARRLRADPSFAEAGGPTRLIALTGYGRDSDLVRAREAGFDGHVLKPVEFKRLESMMAAPYWPPAP